MGANWSSPDEAGNADGAKQEFSERLTITGLGSEWPKLLVGTEDLREYAESIYPADAPWLQKLLMVNAQTGVETRAVLECWNDPMWRGPVLPTIEQVHEAFDKYAPPLTAGAARRALNESGIAASAITHMVSPRN
ncbi:hypothetical protein ONZ43_g4439 [Nemania bipapillata]|uniref:Uncharacterized protein n=1 Tax=Nemania bipapillata TaxID=110536 RepID=A0ACC2IML6_9PEZI|nr:hypothetical protein ONZ43_g4439 [Nemania bipapillata]